MPRAIGYRTNFVVGQYRDPAWEIRYEYDGELHVHTGVERTGQLVPPWIHEAHWIEDNGQTYCDGGCGLGGETIYAPIHTCPSCGHQFEEEPDDNH